MSDQQSMANQLQWCSNTIDLLKDFHLQIRQVAGQYEKTVLELREQQYLEELLAEVYLMQQEFFNCAKELTQHIETEHLGYLDDQAKVLYSQILSRLEAHAPK
jgi:hypothetical protein